uniref:5-oxoprolinase n=1 Tax=Spongospora subterranea TaxID=70186 RepID=A0A0H5R8P8_9EUKA|eukprot:CRZ10490.1 hypothetical protein [Spongospora subterranea]
MSCKYRFAIDSGGTFTDVFAERSDGQDPIILKLLSKSSSYPDAAREGIRRALEIGTGLPHAPDQPLDISNIESIRLGTTVATNSLLERKGARVGLLITKGFADLLQIGNQARPDIFSLEISNPDLLYEQVVEIDERIQIIPNNNKADFDEFGANLKQGITNENVKIITSPNCEQIRQSLTTLKDIGIGSIAIVLMHSFTFKNHEQLIANIAKEVGFRHVTVSSMILPMVKIVSRGFTACADAYLSPCISDYISSFSAGFDNGLLSLADVSLMQSDGGLARISEFTGSRAILSGPAGGVIGYSKSAFHEQPPGKRFPVVGFDMGGTSTDVSRYDGKLEHIFENTIAGISLLAPQLDIKTIAAGGGSCLTVDSGMYHIGPDSAGADPGPACYGKGGPLSLTDANLVLGRIIPAQFPKIFGKESTEQLDERAAKVKFLELIEAHDEECQNMTIEQVAFGFVQVANESMSRPIRNLTQSRGYDVCDHILACFGGAAGQHCCAIAVSLGIKKIFIHRYSGILSAYGISLADVVVERQEPCARPLKVERCIDCYFTERFQALSDNVKRRLMSQGFTSEQIFTEEYLNLRYAGTEQAVMTLQGRLGFEQEFISSYKREFGFNLDRDIVVDDIRVRGMAKQPMRIREKLQECGNGNLIPSAQLRAKCWFQTGVDHHNRPLVAAVDTAVFDLQCLLAGHVIHGPAIIVDRTSTIVVEPRCSAIVSAFGDIDIVVETSANIVLSPTICDPVTLSIFGHRFMGIAEQMGRTLQRTAISTNIKERLDFSCAIFGPDGGLVANAPHLPVHLGAMQEAVKYQISYLGSAWSKGDIIMSNHPVAGGSHLPDITVITPVFMESFSSAVFFVACRGHHSDIGGITPGSMPAFSKVINEEGAAFHSFKLVSNGVFDEAGARRLLSCSRNVNDCISDLHAQVAANNKGIRLLEDLIKQYSLNIVHAYMNFIQDNAERAVRQMLVDLSTSRGLLAIDTVSALDYMDDGSPISLSVTIDRNDGSALFDFAGTGSQVYGNWNAPRAITYSAIIYCLRCLVRRDIPLNQGCLRPIQILIPEGSLLHPSNDAAVVGGNVLTSQRVTDVILLAFKCCAASQGCMNNLSFGIDGKFGYYETIAGGSGAGPNWHGRSAVHTHMTNTRITDPEIFERRYPVILRSFSIRKGSGGNGRFTGGDGVIREIEFLSSLTISILSERRTLSPYGMNGGEPGKRGRNELIRAEDNRLLHLGGKDTYPIRRGDIIRILTPGGGGYGKADSKIQCVE